MQLDSDEEPLSIVTKRGLMGKKEAAVAAEAKEEKLPSSSSLEDKGGRKEDEITKGDIAELTILEQFAATADKSNFEESTKLPKWLYKYLVFRFNLLDRVGETC